MIKKILSQPGEDLAVRQIGNHQFPFIEQAVPADNFGTGNRVIFATPLGIARFVTLFTNSRLSSS